METIIYFAINTYIAKTTSRNAGKDQDDLLLEIGDFIRGKTIVKNPSKGKQKRDTIDSLNELYNGR